MLRRYTSLNFKSTKLSNTKISNGTRSNNIQVLEGRPYGRKRSRRRIQVPSGRPYPNRESSVVSRQWCVLSDDAWFCSSGWPCATPSVNVLLCFGAVNKCFVVIRPSILNLKFYIADIVFYLTFWMIARTGFQSHHPQQDALPPFTLKGFMCLACFLSVYLAHVNQ